MSAHPIDDDAASSSPIGFGPASATWGIAWVLGSGVLAAIAISATGNELGDELPIPDLGVVALVGWTTFLVALWGTSRRFGTGRVLADYALAFRPIDLLGIPLGVLTQLALVPALYWPLQQAWPETFSREQLEERAQGLADRADGSHAVLLVLIVVVGAPIVEELVYRGLLQRSMANVITPWPALCFTAIWFAVIHLVWIELPGLFLAGLVFGVSVVLTNRIGMGIVTHAAFNAAGIAVVLSQR